jgi:His-Xaa-Ser system protein HxsD
MVDRELLFDSSAHSLNAIQRAAYRLIDRLTIDLATRDGHYRCTVHVLSDDPDQIEGALNDLRSEVLDQTLRERIRAETELTRNLILSLAFSQTGLTDGPEEE